MNSVSFGFRENINTKLKMPASGINAEGTWLMLEFFPSKVWDNPHIFHCLYDNCLQNLSICFGIKYIIIKINL